MAVAQKKLTSDFGFKSPGFQVDENGALFSASLNTDNFLINGNSVLSSTGDTLSPVVVNSSLETVGNLTGLTVIGDVNLKQGSVQRLSIIGGRVRINSGLLGSIDNVEIGVNTPSRVVATRLDVTSILNANNVSMSMNNSSVSGSVTFIDGLIVPTPTISTEAASKGYVDNAVIAFSVAFGA